MIPVCQPTVSECDVQAVADVMRTRWLSTGDVVRRFEAALCERTGYPHAVALSSCTAALFLALRAYGVGDGDVVGVPALTFTATAAAVEHTGAEVKFLDVEPATWLLDPVGAPQPPYVLSAVVPVDLYGSLVPRRQMSRWSDGGMLVVEDAAHAMGADLEGRAETVCLSFYATKNITTLGEGGAVLTRNEAVADMVRCMSLHGLSAGAWTRYRVDTAVEPSVIQLGYKANMTDCQAAMGLMQLGDLAKWRDRREEIAERYDDELDMRRPERSTDGIVHLYPVLLPDVVDRPMFLSAMRAKGVGVGVHYHSLTEEPYWHDRYRASCPVAEAVGKRTVSLPLYPHLADEEQGEVIEAVKECLSL